MSVNERILVELETLPKGGITYKKINGRAYAYYQWTQDGRQHSRRVKDEELEELSEKIQRRKKLQEQYRHLMDERKCQETEFRYGSIMGKNVIYRGEAQTIKTDKGEVHYLNVEEYLKGLTGDMM